VDSQPGSIQGLQLVVSDINAARAGLVERGVEVSEIQEFDWGSFVFFSDPDGNGWAVQQLPYKLTPTQCARVVSCPPLSTEGRIRTAVHIVYRRPALFRWDEG
jgi:hypothetical protein